MSDTTQRPFSAAKAFRCLLMAFGLGFFALPAMAAKDCWTLWTPVGPAGRFPELTNFLRTSCSASLSQVEGSFWGALTDALAKPIQYPEAVEETRVVPQGCSPTGREGDMLYGTCRYTYKIISTLNAFPDKPQITEGSGFFEVLLQCGLVLGTTSYDGTPQGCKRLKDTVASPCFTCNMVGDSIEPLTGVKRQTEEIFAWGRGHALTATYLSAPQIAAGGINELGANSFGARWSSNLHRQLVTQKPVYALWQFQRGAGLWKGYPEYGYNPEPTERDPKPGLSADGSVWLYRDEDARAVEVYLLDGRLKSIVYADGRRLEFSSATAPTMSDAAVTKTLLQAIEDETGRRVSFDYAFSTDKRNLQITRIVDPAGVSLPVAYDAAGNMTSINYADQTKREFVYEDSRFPGALTGVKDEAGQRFGTYRYDDQGRAISSATGSLASWQVSWTGASSTPAPLEYYDPDENVVVRKALNVSAGQAVVTKPDGTTSNWAGSALGRRAMLDTRNQPAGAGSAAATTNSSFDAAGNLTRSDDFNGNRSCMAYDARQLEVSRVEGLSTATDCAAVASTLPSGARKLSTRWHPDWRLSTGSAGPLRMTTLVFNGQPDPTNGGQAANCAPGSAAMPDGKPLVLLCKRIEQATTDATGAQGFSATAQAGVPARTTSWTYNATGQVLTETNPRGQVVVTNEYYTDTTADHTKGDLKSTSNIAGHLTRFTRYNAYGKPLEVLDANNLATTYVYDARQRLTSVTSNGKATTYEYWPTGLLKKSSQPGGSAVNYEYDDAHRLVAVSDTLGNRIDYTLDASGNRTKEEAKDPQGALKRTMSRAFDALGRAQQTTGRE